MNYTNPNSQVVLMLMSSVSMAISSGYHGITASLHALSTLISLGKMILGMEANVRNDLNLVVQDAGMSLQCLAGAVMVSAQIPAQGISSFFSQTNRIDRHEIEHNLLKKRRESSNEIIKNVHMFSQAYRTNTGTSLAKRLPYDLVIEIAALTGDSSAHTEDGSKKIALNAFERNKSFR